VTLARNPFGPLISGHKSNAVEPAEKVAAPAAAQTPAPAAPAAPEAIEVPKGTVPEILEWVGDDLEKAQAALDAEHESKNSRKGLVHELEQLLETDDAEGDSDADDE
jgi:hypothetical protein